MAKDGFEKVKELPHILLEALEGQRLRGVGMAITTRVHKPISIYDFKNKINQAIEINSVKLYSKTNTYILMDLTIPYYHNDVFLMLKKLQLTLKSVIDDFKILVATDSLNLSKYIEREKIPANVLNVIRDIKQLDSSYKLGKSLQELIRKDVDRKLSLNVMMRLIDHLEEEEKRTCLERLRSLLYEEKAVSFYPNSMTISCGCSTNTIKRVAELPFIKLITEMPKVMRRAKKSSDQSEIIRLYSPEEIRILEPTENLPTICVIDSGVSSVISSLALYNDPFNFFDLNDTIQHGTSVASVCLFGEDLLERRKILSPKSKIVSVKLDDISIPEDKIMIEEAIMYAIKTYKHLTSVFNLSYNYYDIPEEQRLEIAKRIDQFIQKENVILVNSAGNIFPDAAYYLRDKYPEYITKNPVYSPSDGRNVFSVGSISQRFTNRPVYSRHTRIGIHPIFQNEEIDKYDFIKPEIHAYGGNSEPNDTYLRNMTTSAEGFPVMTTDGSIIFDSGTSYSAPLVSLCLARLYAKYKTILKNSETYKAILLNKTMLSDCSGYTTFSLLDTRNVTECNDGVYINFEGESYPHEKAENMTRKKIIKCKKIDFYMPIEAESIDVVVVHSNTYPEQNIKDFKTKVILKFTKPQGTVCQKAYGNIGRKSAVTYSHYSFKREYEGQWSVDLHIETSGIPAELFDNIRIRFGVSIRINLKKENQKDLKDIYTRVYDKTKSKKLLPIEQRAEIPLSDHNISASTSTV